MTHYLINGLKYARVSHVISQFHPTDKVFPAAVAGVRSAAELGTEMHENIEAYLKGSQTHFEARPQLQAFLAAHVAGKWEFFSSEERIWDPEWRIAGTVDALFYNRVADNYLLVDWKRTRMLYDDSAVQYQLQLNIYQRILARMGRPVVLAGLALLHPRNHGFMWVPVPDIDVSLYVENARYLSEGAAIEEKGQYKRTKASVCGKMDMIKRFFMKDPQVTALPRFCPCSPFPGCVGGTARDCQGARFRGADQRRCRRAQTARPGPQDPGPRADVPGRRRAAETDERRPESSDVQGAHELPGLQPAP